MKFALVLLLGPERTSNWIKPWGKVKNAKREANLTSDILARIESASQKLGQAQKDAEEYLAGISDVLTSAHAEFAAGLTKVVEDGHKEFYQRLSNATSLLRQAIEELASTVEPTMQRA